MLHETRGQPSGLPSQKTFERNRGLSRQRPLPGARSVLVSGSERSGPLLVRAGDVRHPFQNRNPVTRRERAGSVLRCHGGRWWHMHRYLLRLRVIAWRFDLAKLRGYVQESRAFEREQSTGGGADVQRWITPVNNGMVVCAGASISVESPQIAAMTPGSSYCDVPPASRIRLIDLFNASLLRT